MQIPALKRARDRGWTVIMADGNPEPAGKAIPHYFENVDLRDVGGMIAMATKYAEKTGLDGVFTAGTDFSLTVARVAEALGLPGISVEAAENATFKDRMRECFRREGVPSPAFRTITPRDNLSSVTDNIPGPWVVKPVDNMGARGTRRVDYPRQLKEAVKNALRWSASSRVIIEEFMEGPEFSIDAIVEDGRVTVCGLADRHIFFPPYFIEMGHTMPSDAPADDLEEVVRVFRLGIEALGIRNGCAKGDVKLTPEGGKVGEIAARLSGGYMSGWTFPYSSGVDLTGAALNIAVGRPAGDLSPRYRMHSAERAFISVPGLVETVEGIREAEGIPGVRDVFLRVHPGDRVSFPRNNVEKCGNVISRASSRDEAVQAADRAAAAVRIRLVPGDPLTGKFLYGRPEEGCHPVYPIGAEAADMLAGLPEVEGDPHLSGEASLPGIMPCPAVTDDPAEDLHGVTIEDGFRQVEVSGFCAAGPEVSCSLGSLFWKAFVRGGAEGGIWALRSFQQDPRGFSENVRLWSAEE